MKRSGQRLGRRSVMGEMDTLSGYRDLLVWQEAMKFAVMVYHVTQRFPREE
jgi:hypothetical protein